ncbi:undecaprenyl-diphosphate phosphatase [Halalkalibacter krulwichiae]|nr:undecaprenyl-diphosphate phosphatase [Halalkalibacter krulwichiae]
MSYFEAFLLGLIQGLSEFLPISSTALMLMTQRLLDISIGEDFKLAFETFLHIASVLAVIFYFRQELLNILQDFWSYSKEKNNDSKSNYQFTILIFISTITTIGIMTFLETNIGETFTTPETVAVSLITSGFLLILIEHGLSPGNRSHKDLTWKDAIIIGFGQVASLIPGISRTGSSLFLALSLRINKQTALRYTIILSIPVFFGMSIVKLPELIRSYKETQLLALSIAFITSFLSALVGIKWIISLVEHTRLTFFACFCIAFGSLYWASL